MGLFKSGFKQEPNISFGYYVSIFFCFAFLKFIFEDFIEVLQNNSKS